MLQAVKNGVEKAGIDLEESLRMASLYPARVMNRDHIYGCIKPGSAADFAVLDENLNLERAIVGGE